MGTVIWILLVTMIGLVVWFFWWAGRKQEAPINARRVDANKTEEMLRLHFPGIYEEDEDEKNCKINNQYS